VFWLAADGVALKKASWYSLSTVASFSAVVFIAHFWLASSSL
jgi:hypothetical protein